MSPTLSLYIYIYKEEEAAKKESECERDKSLFLFSLLLSSIYVVSTFGIRRANNESSSTRRGLRVSTKNTGFCQEFK